MIIPKSIFTKDGIDVGQDRRNMTYLYGISDFFSYIFEDTTNVNLLLESTSTSASEIYSKFLQLTSSLTIADIQENIGVGIKLILISDEDRIGVTTKYKINQPISSAKFLSNRPFLPTELLEEDIDYRIIQVDTESCEIQFARPINEYSFSRRATVNGSDQYAIWMTDAVIDEQLMYKYYGSILGVNPEISGQQFSDFVYGLYYVYFNGPTIKVLEQGLNLVLGIPLPRSSSTVLDIRVKVDTDQYFIITDNEQYLLPSGILPSVSVGDTIGIGTTLGKWVELKDYVTDGKWWINVSIPPDIIRRKPSSQSFRFALEGSRFDYLMTEYLFRNTFLIQINVGAFNTNKYFQYIADIVSKAKPAGAQPIYVWQVDMTDNDYTEIEELSFSISLISSLRYTINTFPINDYYIN